MRDHGALLSEPAPMTRQSAIGTKPLGIGPQIRMQVERLDVFDDPFGEIGRTVPNVAANQFSQMKL